MREAARRETLNTRLPRILSSLYHCPYNLSFLWNAWQRGDWENEPQMLQNEEGITLSFHCPHIPCPPRSGMKIWENGMWKGGQWVSSLYHSLHLIHNVLHPPSGERSSSPLAISSSIYPPLAVRPGIITLHRIPNPLMPPTGWVYLPVSAAVIRWKEGTHGGMKA